MNFNGKTALVTGAAGTVGWAIAQRLALSGYGVATLVRRDAQSMEEKLRALPNGTHHSVYEADVTDSATLEAVRDQLTDCDILINCAGKTEVIAHSDLQALTDDIFDTMMIDNLRSVFACIRTFYPLLQKGPDSVIVNIGSSSVQGPGGSNLAYVASKAGIESLTKKLAPAIAPIRIFTVSLGGMDTKFVPRSREFCDYMTRTTPLARMTTADDAADVVMCCIEDMKFCTGQTLLVDGGRSL